MSLESVDPAEGFKRHFSFVPAIDQAKRESAFFIRHQVYCRDLGFEPVRDDQRETDEYDSHSLQCLLRTAEEPGEFVGCTRLVLARPDDPAYPLPFEVHCRDTLERHKIDPARMARNKIAEVSRLAVIARFRRRKGEARTPVALSTEDFGSPRQPRFPYIPVSLYLGSVAMAQRQGIEYLFTLTEPRLAEHFSRIGVNIKPIGAPVDHRGIRIPSMMQVDQIIAGLRVFMRPIWNVIQHQIDAEYARQAPPGQACAGQAQSAYAPYKRAATGER